MVTTLSVNEVNDLYINNFNNIDLSVDLEAVKNLCKNAAQAQRGEMIYNTNQGVPTKQTLWQGALI